MRVSAIVPIKLNNERLPNKNLAKFDNGMPLISYVLKTLTEVKEIDKSYVYCSDERIKENLPLGIDFIQRNKNLDTNQTSMNEILYSFAQEICSDVYVLTHATSPFISSESIRKGIYCILNEGYDSAFACEKLNTFAWINGKPNYNIEKCPRTQDLNPILIETSGFYIFKREIIIEHQRRIGFNPMTIQVSKIESIDIDDYQDFQIANAIYNFGLNKKEKSNEKH